MGREAVALVRHDGQAAESKVLLETDEIVVRGELRVKVPLRDLTRVGVSGGTLALRWPGGALEIELGDDAAKWADAIKNPKSRLQKLGIKADQRVVLLSVKDPDLADELAAAGARVVRSGKDVDAVFVQMDAPAALSRIKKAAGMIAPAGAVWTLTPRGVAGLKDADVMAAGKAAGLVDVKVVRFSETHSANKFVIPRNKR